MAHCWTHWRRRFVKFSQDTPSPLCDEMIARIASLYAIEKEVRGRDPATRRAVRQQFSKPIVEALRPWLEACLHDLSSTNELARHIRYGLKRWDGLTRPSGPSSAFVRSTGSNDRCATGYRSLDDGRLLAMDALMDHAGQVKRELAKQIRPLVDRDLAVVFYDLTTVRIHGEGILIVAPVASRLSRRTRRSAGMWRVL